MRAYLHFVSKQDATMSSEAEHMLRDYYVASRINRPSITFRFLFFLTIFKRQFF